METVKTKYGKLSDFKHCDNNQVLPIKQKSYAVSSFSHCIGYISIKTTSEPNEKSTTNV